MTDRTDAPLRELETEVEETRANVAETLDELQNQVAGTIDGLKSRLSPPEIRREVSGYAHDTAVRMAGRIGSSIGRQAADNPLKLIGITALVAYPIVKLVTKVPIPLYLLGAGVAMMRPASEARSRSGSYDRYSSGDYASSSTRTGRDYSDYGARSGMADYGAGTGGESVYASGEFGRRTGSSSSGTVSAGGYTATETTRDYGRSRESGSGISDAASRVTSSVSSGLAQAADSVKGMAQGAVQAGERMLHTGRRTVRRTSRRAGNFATEQPLVIGGLALLVAAAAAAMAPPTRTERRYLGPVRDRLASRARTYVDRGYDATRQAVERAYEVARDEALSRGASPAAADREGREFLRRMNPGSQYEPGGYGTGY